MRTIIAFSIICILGSSAYACEKTVYRPNEDEIYRLCQIMNLHNYTPLWFEEDKNGQSVFLVDLLKQQKEQPRSKSTGENRVSHTEAITKKESSEKRLPAMIQLIRTKDEDQISNPIELITQEDTPPTTAPGTKFEYENESGYIIVHEKPLTQEHVPNAYYKSLIINESSELSYDEDVIKKFGGKRVTDERLHAETTPHPRSPLKKRKQSRSEKREFFNNGKKPWYQLIYERRKQDRKDNK